MFPVRIHISVTLKNIYELNLHQLLYGLLLANRAAILNTLRREFYNQELLRVDLQLLRVIRVQRSY